MRLMSAPGHQKVNYDNIFSHIETMPGAGWAFFPNEKCFVLSKTLAELLKQPALTFIKTRKVLRFLASDKLSKLIRDWYLSHLVQSEFRTVHRLKSNCDAQQWVNISAKPLRMDNGRSCWLGSVLTITNDLFSEYLDQRGLVTVPRKDYEEAVASRKFLEDREHQLSLVVSTIPAVIWETELDGKVTFFNQRSAQFPGFVVPAMDDPHEAIMSVMRTVIHPDDQERLEQAIITSMRTGEGWMERYRRRTDGGYRWLQGRTHPLRDENGDVIRWYGFAIDIDDDVRGNEKLQTATSELERVARIATMAELSASISHEVSQPLAALAVNADACRRWLVANPPNVDKALISAENVLRDALLSSEIVKTMRSMFQLGEQERVRANIHAIIKDVCHLFMSVDPSRRAIVVQELDECEPWAVVDTLQIRQVLMNLLRNSLEAGIEAGIERPIIQVATVCTDDTVRICVVDDSGGIADLSRVFDAFYTTKQQGTGMGLAICRTIIVKHGGRIDAENKGLGASIGFTLPRT